MSPFQIIISLTLVSLSLGEGSEDLSMVKFCMIRGEKKSAFPLFRAMLKSSLDLHKIEALSANVGGSFVSGTFRLSNVKVHAEGNWSIPLDSLNYDSANKRINFSMSLAHYFLKGQYEVTNGHMDLSAVGQCATTLHGNGSLSSSVYDFRLKVVLHLATNPLVRDVNVYCEKGGQLSFEGLVISHETLQQGEGHQILVDIVADVFKKLVKSKLSEVTLKNLNQGLFNGCTLEDVSRFFEA